LETRNPTAGDLVAERYRLTKRLGEGAAGEVWLARDTRLEIDVAVKLLRAAHTARAAILASFAREADLSERMLSPNVVKVLGRGVTPAGVPYIVYERLEGEDLASRLATVRRLALAEAKTVVVHACRALARAHAVGALHRDVKPENLFLSTDTEGRLLVKLLDFGVAEITAQRDGSDGASLVGTLEYLAPEVLLGERPASPRSDLYSLGVVAYECLTGRVPRKASTVGELVFALARGKVDQASALRFEIMPELDAWLSRALDRDPDERFPSAKEMAEALHVAMKSSQPSSDPRLVAGSIRPRATSFVFEEERRASAQYSIIRPEVEVVPAPIPSRRPPSGNGSSSS